MAKRSRFGSMLEAINARLALLNDGVPIDQAALDVARRALLAGEARDATVFRVAKVDAAWYCEHAADIVRARPADIEYALQALTSVPAAGRARALQSIQNLGKPAARAVARWTKEHPELFEHRE